MKKVFIHLAITTLLMLLCCPAFSAQAASAPTLSLWNESSDVNYYLGLTFDAYEPVYSANNLFGVFVNDPAPLIAAYGDSFQWSVKQIKGDPLIYQYFSSSWENDTRGFFGYLEEMPEKAMTAVFEITCTLGSMTDSTTVTAHFLSVPLPTGVNGVPEEIDVYVGQPFSLTGTQILPQGWSLTGYSVNEFFEDGHDLLSNYDWTTDGLNLTPVQAGDYDVAYVAGIDTIIIAKYITFHVHPWNDWDMILPNDLVTIEDEAFRGVNAKAVKIQGSVTAIGANAFADSQVNKIFIPTSVTSIAADALPLGTVIYTPAGSYAEQWAANKYQVIHAQ